MDVIEGYRKICGRYQHIIDRQQNLIGRYQKTIDQQQNFIEEQHELILKLEKQMQGRTVKIIIGFFILGGYAILFTTGFKHGWHEGALWFVIGYTALLGGAYLINKHLTRNK